MRYVALGDSYTIGEGVSLEDSFPYLLADSLKSESINLELFDIIAKTGWTTQNFIEEWLSRYKKLNPTFSTLLIGVNDWVQGVDRKKFRNNLRHIIYSTLAVLPEGKLVLMTIPDFSVTPEGYKYARGRDISQGIYDFNQIVLEEGERRELPVVDIYPETQRMARIPELIAEDGLHPSRLEYERWKDLVLPIAKELLPT